MTSGQYDYPGSIWPAGLPAGKIQSQTGVPVHLGEVITRLNLLLRGELSAAETYTSALDKLADSPPPMEHNVGLIVSIRNEHNRCANRLGERVYELGGDPVDSSGTRGTVARLAMAATKLLGSITILRALRETEQHALKEYQACLNELDPNSRDLIENHLIPSRQKHIRTLERLIEG